jgi:ribosomal-protein-alanine N-acetyltransferase
VIKTERLILRALTPGDAQEQFDVLKDPEVSGGIGVFSQPFTMEQAQRWCSFAAQCHTVKKGYLCAVFEKASQGEIRAPQIGYAGTACADPARDDCIWEVGYWLEKKYWGKGYVPEALKALMAYAVPVFSLKGFFAEMAEDNANSAAVARKCGFTWTESFTKNTPHDPARPSRRYHRLWAQ